MRDRRAPGQLGVEQGVRALVRLAYVLDWAGKHDEAGRLNAQALALSGGGDALPHARATTRLLPERPASRLLQGKIAPARLHGSEVRAAYLRALKLAPDHERARAGLSRARLSAQRDG